jgi:hypothetical protein
VKLASIFFPLAVHLACGHAQSTSPPTSTTTASRHFLVVLHNGYWTGGFDAPLLIALTDGTVIYPTRYERLIPSAYGQVRLDPGRFNEAFDTVVTKEAIRNADTLYDFAPGVTDQYSVYFLLQPDSQSRVVQLRAALDSDSTLQATVPQGLRDLFARIRSFRPPDGVKWLPDSIEVSAWPYEYAPDNPPLAWPDNWPLLSSPRWSRRKDDIVEEMWTLRLPYADADRLDRMLRARREKQAIGISGRKLAVGYRWVFPAEHTWRWLRRRMET